MSGYVHVVTWKGPGLWGSATYESWGEAVGRVFTLKRQGYEVSVKTMWRRR